MPSRILHTWKRDVLGRVEQVEGAGGVCVRRIACGCAWPGTGFVARRLMHREREALRALKGMADVPQLLADPELVSLPDADGRVPRPREVLLRSWIGGAPLHEATHLPADFFDLLDALVEDLHGRGVCHNDLHKEQNIVVGDDGRPALIDFQLASVHAMRGPRFATRCHEDLRHLQKHRRRYTRDGRAPHGVAQEGAGAGRERRPLSKAWRRFGKPVYLFVTRSLLRTKDGEARRDSAGPWPTWGAAIGPKRPG
tara:strand:- start:154 stop:915 length:762 start_codon:yes stop_codon:yes gene_type:complete